jgi:hypothetical protein
MCRRFSIAKKSCPFLSSLLLTTAVSIVVALPYPVAGQEPVSDEALREQLQTRDAIIIELQRRLEELEQRLDEAGVLEMEEPEEPVQPAATPRPQPGQGLQVDELSAERALERTLVEQGALLIPFGQAELNPSTTYTRREGNVPFLLDGQVVEQNVKRNEFEFGLGMAVGLPFDSQFELNLPYNLVNQEVTGRSGGAPFTSNSDWGHAIGDLSVGLSKTVLREDGNWWPDIVVRGTWDTNTGERSDNDVPLDGSFNELIGSVTMLKRKDPLAFIGQFSYSYTFEDDDIQPGQQFGLALGANVALSPETSLSVTLNQTYTDDLEFDGDNVDGSDQLASTFDFGGSVIVAPRTLLRVISSIGLTDDAPDYGLRAAVSYRFNTPF